MTEPRILSIGRATPRQRYAQSALIQFSPWPQSPLISRLFLDSPVMSRSLWTAPKDYAHARSLSETNAAWRDGALALGEEATTRALVGAQTDAQQIGFFGVTTVTGYCTPGLDLLLAPKIGLSHHFSRAHFNCIGCHAAVPLLKVAADHVRLRPTERALTLAVEICSACFSAEDTPQNIVASSLFGDGAAAVVIGTEGAGPALVDFGSTYDFEAMHTLGFELGEQGFRIVLDPSIPARIAGAINTAVDDLLSKNNVERSQISRWLFHPGGSAILDAVQSTLSLNDEALRFSRRVLRQHGNMSSPSVLFVLAECLSDARPPRGSFGFMAAFGPGLGIETCLLRFD